ncbi:MAG: HIT domain-containing protein [Nitrospinaceae bacterium]|nr:histidine triad nucleotide-binding protein [Nitrospinaceae bacterium]NIR55452.1 histidine triad nucleotide-binding protein [Nitrospinaceae bacterium]NIS85892.1 histidine triad nucleotide-binding protein [Nitrospinaceae bacterium]NIT82736.1 histidine triad nucleotide-binding protein [Nitrospinaceae bacterium]NIU44945.1 histidine triad nucleotide-binding protein [Nitrospinaceae bacterium]
MEDCLFCKINQGEIPSEKVYDGEQVFAIQDINPQAPVHLLIIPKKHYSTILEIEEKDHDLIGTIFTVAIELAQERKLDQSGFRVVVNCGAEAGQSVFHIHYHLLGGRPMRWPPG